MAGWFPLAAGPGTTTLNNSDKSATVTLSGGNLIATQTNVYGGVRSITSYSSGKKYMEYVPSVSNGAFDYALGIANATHGLASGNDATCALYFANTPSGTVDGNGGTLIASMAAYGVSNVIGMAVDIGNSRIWFRVDGGLWNNSGSADPVANIGGGDISYMTGSPIFVWIVGTNSSVQTANFGASAYAHAAPTGYTNW